MVKRTLSFHVVSPFSKFRHIWLHDGSSQAVVALLKDALPGPFKTVSPAAVALHTTMDLLTDNLVRVEFTEDTRSERACLPALANDLGDTLMMIDAGYFDLEYFMAVHDREGCFFVGIHKVSTRSCVGLFVPMERTVTDMSNKN